MAVRRTKVAAPAEDTQNSVPDEPKSATPPRRSYSGGGGWGAPQSQRRETVSAPYLDVKEAKVIKILSEMPDLFYLQHFMGPGKAPVMCYASGKANPELEIAKEKMAESNAAGLGDCPICTEAPSSASYGFLLNVVDMTEDGDKVRKWTFGNNFKNILESLAQEKRTSPLNRETDEEGKYRPLYFRVHQAKVNGAWQSTVHPLKADDLRDDYDLEPLTEEQVEAFQEKKYGEEVMFYWPLNKMKEFAPIVAEIQRKAKEARDNKG
jgi:hypothetical protein